MPIILGDLLNEGPWFWTSPPRGMNEGNISSVTGKEKSDISVGISSAQKDWPEKSVYSALRQESPVLMPRFLAAEKLWPLSSEKAAKHFVRSYIRA